MKNMRLIVAHMIIYLLISCSNFEGQGVIEPSITVSPSQTLSITKTPNVGTSLPVLSNDEAKKLVQELLVDNAGCRLPCWWGIAPGKTTWVEARHFLESFAVYIGETGGVRVPLPSPYSDATYMDHGYFINNGIVENIHIYNFNLAPNYYLPKFLENYGQPSEVWIQTFSQEEIGQWNFTFYLFYIERGILVEYGLATPIEDAVVDRKLQNCLKYAYSPFIYLWSPEQSKLSFQDAIQKFPYSLNTPEPMPLLDATGMDVKTFFETFKNPETNTCIETPKDLWE
jgi:hypothetical protein